MGYIVREGLSGFRRTKVASVGSTLTIAAAVFILGVFGLFWFDTVRIDAALRGSIDMEAFLEEPAGGESQARIEREILADSGVAAVRFVSKEEAAEIFRREFGEDAGEVLDFNPFPPSYRITLREGMRNAAAAESVSARIGAIAGVDEVVFRRELLSVVDRNWASVRSAGIAVGALVALATLFIVANTIRLAIAARRKSVQAMKLVGASRTFVRAPFVLEGMVQGIIGAALAGVVLHWLASWISGMVGGEHSGLLAIEPVFYALVLAAGVALGAAGSLIAVARFIGEDVSSG